MKGTGTMSIKWKILLLTFLGTFLLSASLIIGMVYSMNVLSESSRTIAVDGVLDQVKDGMKNQVDVVVTNSLAQYEREKGSIPEAELIANIYDNIRKTRYADGNYCFVYDYDGTKIVTPDNVSLEGTSGLALTDKNGVQPIKELIAAAKAGGEFVSYIWLNPANKTDEQKLSYGTALKLGSTEVMIGTGTYLPMLEKVESEMSTSIQRESSQLLAIMITVMLLITSVILAVTFLYYNRSVIKPIVSLKGMADRLAVGDIDVEAASGANDEIGDLTRAFGKMADSIGQQAIVAQSISDGNMAVEFAARSEKDVLSKSMLGFIGTLKALAGEFDLLMKASAAGDLAKRGDVGKFKGQYAVMLKGVNAILDEVEKAFNQIKANQIITEKQAQYQTREVEKLLVNLERLAQGEVRCDITAEPADQDTEELYRLFTKIGNSLDTSVSFIKEYIDEISSVLQEVSEGNLNVTITREYVGDFTALKDSINSIIDSLNDTMAEIGSASEQMASGTQQVAAGSQALSQGATEQASAIEQLTASITDIAGQTRQNAIGAGKASELAASARSGAESGDLKMRELQQAMAGINESSASISRIIKVIDEIAFQTNLLALNAAVEAARAGQHGKGFAVVAEEVRNLAQRSAGAAKETTVMIEESINKAKDGSRITDETAKALNNIMESVEKAAELVGGIAAASNDQATAVAQVNRGIEQVSQVTQTNSATAEESAAAGEELSSQAVMLKEMVGRFRLRGQARRLK